MRRIHAGEGHRKPAAHALELDLRSAGGGARRCASSILLSENICSIIRREKEDGDDEADKRRERHGRTPGGSAGEDRIAGSGAADAEARAATALEELTGAREARSNLEAELEEAVAARETAEGELARTRSEAAETRMGLAEAAVKYREAKLAAAPEIPQELVPAAESLAEIDEAFEAARRVAAQLRERIEDERLSARVPVGSPSRRPTDLSALSASEKIRLRLQQLSER